METRDSIDSVDAIYGIERNERKSEPEVFEDTDGYLRMNIDLETATGEEYAMITLDNQHRFFTVTTDTQGSVRVIAGSDSEFESPTTSYYDRINITFTEE